MPGAFARKRYACRKGFSHCQVGRGRRDGGKLPMVQDQRRCYHTADTVATRPEYDRPVALSVPGLPLCGATARYCPIQATGRHHAPALQRRRHQNVVVRRSARPAGQGHTRAPARPFRQCRHRQHRRAPRRQQQGDRLALLVDCPVEVSPAALTLMYVSSVRQNLSQATQNRGLGNLTT